MRKFVAVVSVAIAVLATSACSGSAIDAFDRDQTESDLLPQEFIDSFSGDAPGIDLDSTRFLVEERGFEYFAATANDEQRDLLCLIVVPTGDAELASSACGGAGWVGTSLPPLGVQAELNSHFHGEREGWREMAPGLYAKN